MENASKALLIAAGVLIVILLITFGIRIFSSVSETGKTGTQLGKTISDKTSDAINLITSADNKKIVFKINNESFTAENGMTWGQWCNSSYNTKPFVIKKQGGMYYITYNGDNLTESYSYYDGDMPVSMFGDVSSQYEDFRDRVIDNKRSYSCYEMIELDDF